MADPIVNFFKSTLVGTYSDTDTSITIATGDGALLPDPSTEGAFNLTIFEGLQVTNSTTFEIVRVTARSGDVLTVTRGAESTTPLTIGSATHSILMSATKKTFDDINTAIANVNVTTLTGVEELTFDSTGDEEFGLPAGTTAQRPSSPSAGYMRWNSTDSRIEFYNGSRWAGLSEIGFEQVSLGVAQLSVTANDAVAENVAPEVEYLVIAGGGGAGFEGGLAAAAGGGGAGGYRSSVTGESSGGGASAESVFEPTLSTNYTVTVGGGGAGATTGSAGSNGSNSVFNTITSNGGGGGGANISTPGNGGSGGGAGAVTSAGLGTANQGFDGGTATIIDYQVGGGGGGASEVGGNGVQNGSGATGGDGGDGVSSSITGSAVTRAGGGAGSGDVRTTNFPGTGGAGGGGDASTTAGQSGTTNTGGGGGAGGTSSSGSGGSGVVILRYSSDLSITIGAGLTGTETTDGSEKYAVITAGTGNVSWT